MHLIKRENKYVLYNEDSMEFYTLKEELGKNLESLGDEGIMELAPKGIVIESKDIELEERLNRLVLVISQECNLGCKYCYAKQGSYGESNARFMTMETVKKSIELALEKYPKGIEKIQFFGGEPLTNYKLMIESCKWITDRLNKDNIELPQFTVVTNGTILNEEIVEAFNKYKINVTVSLDGNKEINDINRIFKGNNNSVFDKVKETIKFINKDREYMLCVEMTVTDENIKQFVKNDFNILDIEVIHSLNPDALHIVPAAWPDEEGQYGEEYNQYISKYFDKATKYSIDSLKTCSPMSIVKVVDMVEGLLRKDKKKNFCAAGINEFSVSANGDIYPCFAFINNKEYKMGNVHEDSTKRYNDIQAILKNNHYDSVEKCRSCWAKGICTNCIGNSYLVNGSINKPIENFCRAQKTQLERVIVECERLLIRK